MAGKAFIALSIVLQSIAFVAPFAQCQERPNIVLILADDMGYGDVKANNPLSKILTPHLDRLANQGMRFTDAHSPSAVCTPTRYGVLTGRYSWRTDMKRGVLGGYSPALLESDRMTLGNLLQSAGYQTAAIGKWHLGMAMPFKTAEKNTSPWQGDPGIDFAGVITDSPIHHGFDYYFGVSASLDMAPYVYIRNDRFTMLPTEQQPAVKFPHFVRRGPRAKDFIIDEALDRLTDEAVEFITKSAAGDHPFFLYFPLTAPHKPTQPHQRFQGKTDLGEYGDFIVQVDDTVGRVMSAIDSADIAENTLVLYTSDNGSYMFRYGDPRQKDHTDEDHIQGYRESNHVANGPFRGTKADIFEAGHHVPFFVRWPAVVASGSVCDTTVCHVDLFATFAEILGHQLGQSTAEDSCSFLGNLQGDSSSRGAPVIHQSGNGTLAIRDGKWKLVLSNGSGGREKPTGKPMQKPFQLFDLAADQGETRDLASDQPNVVQELTQRCLQIRDQGFSRPDWPID